MKKKNNRAQALILVFVYISLVSIVGLSLMTYAGKLRKLVGRHTLRARAFYAAEAGLIMRMTQLYNITAVTPNITFPDTTIMDGAYDQAWTCTVLTSVVANPEPTTFLLRARVQNWR